MTPLGMLIRRPPWSNLNCPTKTSPGLTTFTLWLVMKLAGPLVLTVWQVKSPLSARLSWETVRFLGGENQRETKQPGKPFYHSEVFVPSAPQPPLTHLNPVRRAGGVGSLQDEVDAVVDEVLLVDLSEAADGEVAANERMARLHPDNSDNRKEMSLQAG